MIVFGREPAAPDSLPSCPGNLEAHSDSVGPGARASQIRVAAIKRFVDYDNSIHLRRAMLRAVPPATRDFETGDKVAFWRDAPRDRKGKAKPPGYQRGIIIGKKGSHNYWISSQGRLVLASREQLRDCAGTELWTPDDADIEELWKTQANLEKEDADYEDATQETGQEQPPPTDEGPIPFVESDSEGQPVPPTPAAPQPAPPPTTLAEVPGGSGDVVMYASEPMALAVTSAPTKRAISDVYGSIDGEPPTKRTREANEAFLAAVGAELFDVNENGRFIDSDFEDDFGTNGMAVMPFADLPAPPRQLFVTEQDEEAGSPPGSS